MQGYIGSLQTDILGMCGRAAHDRAVTMAADRAIRPVVRSLSHSPVTERVEQLLRMLRASGSRFTVHEDADTVTVRASSWGPARQCAPAAPSRESSLDENFNYPSYGRFGRDGYALLAEGSPVTGGYTDLPCALALEVMLLVVLPLEEWGEPWAVPTFPPDWSGPTVLTVYKTVADVPESVYERAQVARPAQVSRVPVDGPVLAGDADLVPVRRAVLLRRAAESGDLSLARLAARTMDADLTAYEGVLTVFVTSLLTFIARVLGESAVVPALARPVQLGMAATIERWAGMSPRERLALLATFWRAHGSTFWIDEFDDHFLLHGRPLGACHRLWWPRYDPRIRRISDSRIRYPTFGAYAGPAGLHLLRERRAITCGQRDYPIYSARCHLAHEIMPIRQGGHPLWVERHPIADPKAETVHLVMKDDARWPNWVVDRLSERALNG